MSWHGTLTLRSLVVVGIFGVSCGGGSQESTASGVARNAPVARDADTVVLVTVDALRPAHLGPYGYPLDTTPRLTELAAAGVVFEDHVTTTPGINAGLASLFTGRYAQEHAVGSLRHRGLQRLAPSRETLAEAFRGAGWRTFGAVSMPQLRGDVSGLDQGFDTWLEPALFEGDSRTADQSFFNARTQLRELLSGDEPAFVFFQFADPGARTPADGVEGTRFLADHLGRFSTRRPLIADALARLAAQPLEAQAEIDKILRRGRGSEEHTAWRAAGYDSRVAFFDRHLGALVDLLRECGRFERSLIAVTATRGALLAPPPGAGGAGFLPAIVRTPLVVRFPGGTPVERVTTLSRTIDIAPTLVELFGLQALADSSGSSLVGAVERGQVDSDAIAFCEAASLERRAVLDAHFQLEENRVGGIVAYRRDGTRIVREDELADAEAARVAALRAALEQFRRPAAVVVDCAHDVSVGVHWTFDAGFAGPAWVERGGERAEARVSGLGGSKDIEASADGAAARLVLEASRRELPVLLRFDFGETPVDEASIRIGALPLSRSLLPRLPAPSSATWPEGEGGVRVACDAALAAQGSKWWKLSVGHEKGEAGRAVEVLAMLRPSGPLDEQLEWSAGASVSATPVAGRLDACLFVGTTPFEVDIEKSPSRAFALAIRVDGETLAGATIRYRDRLFAQPGELALYLPDWVAGVTDDLAFDPPDPGSAPIPAGTLRITRQGPGVAADERTAYGVQQLEFVERLGSSE